MHNVNGHIISSFNWHTSFDKKERASEMQERLSGWSRLVMQKEIEEIFDKICPAEQTWRIQSLELDLGPVNYSEMEFELSMKLREQLTQKLIDFIIYSNKSGNKNIEILNEENSQLSVLESFLLHGLMPWSHKTGDGSPNELMALQLRHNHQQLIAMIWEAGTVHHDVRKRIAWQFNEPNITGIIAGLEPNNHSQIIDFSNELSKIQQKETVVQTSNADFKKNVWLHVLNYLFNERGTIYNKIAFMKSNIRQMANRYNMEYDELLELIDRAVEKVSDNSHVKPDFILTLKILSKEKKQSDRKAIEVGNTTINYWVLLENLFHHPSLRKKNSGKAEFNDLVVNLSKEDKPRFTTLILSLGDSEKFWHQTIADLNDPSLELIFSALHSTKASTLINCISFLVKLGKEIKLKAKREIFWEIGMKFLKANKNASFETKTFLNYCIAELAERSSITPSHVLQQLSDFEIPGIAKTTSSLEIYTQITAALADKISVDSSLHFEDEFSRLLNSFSKQIVTGNIKKNVFSSLQQSLIRKIQLHPKTALRVFSGVSDKTKLSRLIPFLLNDDTIKLLINSAGNEAASTLLGIHKLITETTSTKISPRVISWLNQNFLEQGLYTLLLYPESNQTTFVRLLMKQVSENIPAAEFEEYLSGLQELFANEKSLLHTTYDKTIQRVFEKYNRRINLSVTDKINVLLSSSKANQLQLGKMLTRTFTDKKFIEWRRQDKIKSNEVLNYLLKGGQQFMNTIVNKYFLILRRVHKTISEKEVKHQLAELYWKCILNFASHGGRKDKLEQSFHSAFLFHYSDSLVESTLNIHDKTLRDFFTGNSSHSTVSTTIKNEPVLLKNYIKISPKELFLLIEECIVKGLEETKKKNASYRFTEIFTAGLESSPKEIRRIISKVPVSEKRIQLLKSAVSFRELSLWIMSDTSGKLNTAMETMRLMADIVMLLANPRMAETLVDEYWEQTWQLIKTNSWSEENLKKLIHDSFIKMATEMDLSADHVLSEMKKKDLKITPALSKNLAECFPAFSVLQTTQTTKSMSDKLGAFERKDLVDTLCIQLITLQQLPSWYGNASEEETKELLNEIIAHHPLKFLAAIKKETISESQMRWMSHAISFKELVRSIGYLNRNKQSHFSILQEFYFALGKISIRGITSVELQSLLFRKVLTAWTNNNWKILSVENIWNEILWEVCTKRSISKKEFIHDIEKVKNLFPPALQVSFENIKPLKENSVLLNKMPVLKPTKQLSKSNEIPRLQKGGIAVRNAGIVLLNSYMAMLFDRLKIVVNKKFVNDAAQLDAVHYLQYVVTGLTQTDESLLPLNKVLCGIPLSKPIHDRINISDENKKLIDSLIKAAIGHWPVIGECSITGFRGNWLVRDGLLVEHEDRWELTVEKRAYDILIHKSPFSFSIIKYPWMGKPLHVTWPY